MVNPKFSARLGAICSASLRAFNFRNPIFWVMLIFGDYSLIFIQLIETEKIKNRDWNAYQSGLKPRFETQFVPYLATLDEGIDFRRAGYPVFVKAVGGFGEHENWGAWTNANQAKVATIEFTEPLPAHFILEFQAQAYGPNSALPTTIQIGQQVQKVQIEAAPKVYRLTIDNPDRANRIEIIPPAPSLPKFISMANATSPESNIVVRRLGIGLITLKIIQ